MWPTAASWRGLRCGGEVDVLLRVDLLLCYEGVSA